MGQLFWCFFQKQDQMAHLSYIARLSHLFFAPKGWLFNLGWDFKQIQMLQGCELRPEKPVSLAFLLSSSYLYNENKGQAHKLSQDSTLMFLSKLLVFSYK